MSQTDLNVKQAAIKAAFAHQEGPYVPTIIGASGPTVAWAGKRVIDIIHQPEEYTEALTAVFKDMWCDGNAFLAMMFTERVEQAFGVVQNKFGPDGTTPEHVQLPYMEDSEYKELIAQGPDRFVSNVLLPRKYPWLFTDKERAKEALKVYAEDNYYCLFTLGDLVGKKLEKDYGIKPIMDYGMMWRVPIDVIFDMYRGFKGTVTDLRRHPSEVHGAMDAIWNEWLAPQMNNPVNAELAACQMPHIAPYLSPKQFMEFYWPHQKAFIEHYAAKGTCSWIMFESKWSKFWECFNDVPQDSVIAHIDDDDFIEAKKTFGKTQLIEGGVRLTELRCASFADIRDKVAKTVDECAVGGGFFFSPDKSLISPGDINQTLVDCYNFVHEYTQK